MRARLLYMLVFIFCLSAFASSKNECTCPKGIPCEKSSAGNNKLLPSKEVSRDMSEEKFDVCPSDNEPQVRSEDFSTFQLAKFLYI